MTDLTRSESPLKLSLRGHVPADDAALPASTAGKASAGENPAAGPIADIDAEIKREKIQRAFPCFYGREPTSLYNR